MFALEVEQSNALDSDWSGWIDRLRHFRSVYGHTDVPPKWEGDPRLACWVASIRARPEKLSFDQLWDLDQNHFDFKANRYWMGRFMELLKFRQIHDHCNVPAKWPENPGLGSWVSGQRLRRKSLSMMRHRLLEMAGMDWNPLDNHWEAKFQELAAFKAVHGHCRVSDHHNRKLALWVGNIRARRKVTPMQKRRLDKLGFVWNVEDSLWQQHLADLKDFVLKFGHTNVPARWPENKSLATWVFSLRSERSSIPASSRKELEKLGFDFQQVHMRLWERRFQELALFAQQHGHCRVPIDYPANPELGRWVGTQRANFEGMSRVRKERLLKLGFIWKTLEMSPRRDWDQRYLELLAFRRKYGHVNVPRAWPENQPLAHWVARQRKRDKPKLTRQQFKKLNDIDFVWDERDRRWRERVTALIEFKTRFGHCDVPGHWSENKTLGTWTYKVREQRRAGKLASERIQELTRLGFRWEHMPEAKKQFLAREARAHSQKRTSM